MPSISKPRGWSDLKRILSVYNPRDLIHLVHDLFNLSGENQRFLRSRLLGGDSEREEYRKRILHAVYPDPLGNDRVRVPEAHRMIRQYYRASGDLEGAVELSLDALDAGVEQGRDLGMYEEYYERLMALGDTFVKLYEELPPDSRKRAWERFQDIAKRGEETGWGFDSWLQEAVMQLRDT